MESSLPQAVPAYSWVPWNLLLNGLNSDCFVNYCPVKHYDDENKHWIFPSRYQALGSWLWPRLKCYWQQFGTSPTIVTIVITTLQMALWSEPEPEENSQRLSLFPFAHPTKVYFCTWLLNNFNLKSLKLLLHCKALGQFLSYNVKWTI